MLVLLFKLTIFLFSASVFPGVFAPKVVCSLSTIELTHLCQCVVKMLLYSFPQSSSHHHNNTPEVTECDRSFKSTSCTKQQVSHSVDKNAETDNSIMQRTNVDSKRFHQLENSGKTPQEVDSQSVIPPSILTSVVQDFVKFIIILSLFI